MTGSFVSYSRNYDAVRFLGAFSDIVEACYLDIET